MELFDHLLAILAGPDSTAASRQLMAAGYTEDKVRGAWNFARSAGYTESTGLGADRLTPADSSGRRAQIHRPMRRNRYRRFIDRQAAMECGTIERVKEMSIDST